MVLNNNLMSLYGLTLFLRVKVKNVSFDFMLTLNHSNPITSSQAERCRCR